MTGTDAACLHTNQSRSYLNHLVLTHDGLDISASTLAMKLRPGLILEPRDVTRFRNVLSSCQLCQNINMRISISVLLHVLYGCETRFLPKTGHVYSGEDSPLHGHRRHNVIFRVSRVLGNGASNRTFERKGRGRGRGENYITLALKCAHSSKYH